MNPFIVYITGLIISSKPLVDEDPVPDGFNNTAGVLGILRPAVMIPMRPVIAKRTTRSTFLIGRDLLPYP